jgi:hypothetical protein
VRGVTAENYAAYAKPFIAAGLSRMISRLLPSDEEPNDTRRQWGAWLSYFLRHRIPAKQMGVLNVYMVPAEWPHLFDADETIADDYTAGKRFIAATKPRHRTVNLVPDRERGFIAHRASNPQDPFRPYPKLWEFFASDAEAIAMLDTGLPFEFVTALSRDMAMGTPRQKLRNRLEKRFLEEEEKWKQVLSKQKPKTEWTRPYKPPPFDISDFPDAPER